jgi:hypothetical protein
LPVALPPSFLGSFLLHMSHRRTPSSPRDSCRTMARNVRGPLPNRPLDPAENPSSPSQNSPLDVHLGLPFALRARSNENESGCPSCRILAGWSVRFSLSLPTTVEAPGLNPPKLGVIRHLQALPAPRPRPPGQHATGKGGLPRHRTSDSAIGRQLTQHDAARS